MLTSDNINLGSGELFCVPFDRTTKPALDMNVADIIALCIEDNRLSHIKNGATLSYGAEYYKAIDDLEIICKTIASSETIEFKSGLMSWNASTLEKLAATAHAVSGTNFNGLQLGGTQNYEDRKYHFVFKHQDKKHYLYFVGQSQTSFDIVFQKGQETVIDADFSCDPELHNASGNVFNVFYFEYIESPVPGPAPTGLTPVATSAPGEADGMITGTDTTMEWRAEAASTYTACTGSSIEDLASGKYYVRYKATASSVASLDAEVIVVEG